MASLRRSHFLLGTAVALVPRIALGADAVRVGTANLVSDAPLFIADKLGYFKDQNIDVQLTYIASGSQMIAPLGTGELDAGAGAPSAALYNAATRGINIRAVADKGRLAPGYGYNPIMVRKDLWDDGSIRSLHDLGGRVFANAATGGASDSTINEALKKGGLGWTDIKMTILPFADMSAGFQNHAIDAACVSEPFATAMAQKGLAVKLAGSDTFYPNQQIAVLFFGSRFIEDRSDVARRFMVAYVRGLRYYYDGLKNGHYAGPHGQNVVAILSQYTPVKDPSIYAAMVPAGIDPNGYLNVASMEKDLELWRRLGEVTDPITAAHVVDLSFVDAANRTLGRYQA